MSEKLYHDCYENVCRARALFEDLRYWGYEVFPEPEQKPLQPAKAPCPGGGLKPALPLAALQQEVSDCRRCSLAQTRTHVVFGRGNPEADLVFIGEAPGAEEDLQGLPFVGEAGRLLDRIIFAMGLSGDQVYICNLIKCRPPGNRDPLPEEVACCEPFLKKQLEYLRPVVIVTLGRFSTQALLGVQTPIGKVRGNWCRYQGIDLMPTYHPAHLLRSPGDKRLVWNDMKQVMARLNREVKPAGR